MELGADAVLVNTAIAVADDPVLMARAFCIKSLDEYLPVPTKSRLFNSLFCIFNILFNFPFFRLCFFTCFSCCHCDERRGLPRSEEAIHFFGQLAQKENGLLHWRSQ
jgi:hypothetical protein